MTLPLVIDTDVALGVIHEGRPRDIDDGFAIIEALNLEAIDLRAVTTVYGNAPLADTDRVAREIVALKQATVTVGRGAARSLPETGSLPPPNDAVEVMRTAIANGARHIAAIGPLTNVGLLLHHYPECATAIEEIVIVAGRSPGRTFFIGDKGPVRDFNFENDVRATEILLSTGVAVTLAGFELTSQVVVTATDLANIAARKTRIAEYLYRNSIAWLEHWIESFPADTGFHPWDSAAVAWLTNPQWFVAERRSAHVSPKIGTRPAWLECSPGGTFNYLTGFAPGGAAAFVRGIVDNVY